MNTETKQILAEMGFNVGSVLNVRRSPFLGLELTIRPNGTGTVVFCNGGLSEYLFLAQYGAVKPPVNDDDESILENIKTVANGIPYLTISKYKFLQVLEAMAFNRLCLTGADKGKKGGSVAKSKRLAALWFKRIPKEENEFYNAKVTTDAMESELIAS